jgi:oligopeptide/dipeptide ABC transporter ATP-binding protein
MSAPLLSVEDLSISFPGEGGHVRVVDRVSLSVAAGETLALVGESGSGKSMTALAILRLIPKPGRIEPGGRIQFEGRDLLSLSVPDMRAIRGARIGMIFQEPMTSLNPVTTVGDQVMEAIELHADIPREEARGRVMELFGLVGIPDPKSRFTAYPHQLSGGLKQRVLIAMAMAMRPRLLIADEPTTALDATIRAQILELLRDLSAKTGTAVLLITHDFGVVNEVADHVAVMYAGQIVEEGDARTVFSEPAHPYTRELLRSVISLHTTELNYIPGAPPDLADPPPACRFHPRCPDAMRVCAATFPPTVDLGGTRQSECWLNARDQIPEGEDAPLEREALAVAEEA